MMKHIDLELLNDEQRAAVLHHNHALLILAGAGSGKTRVITTKIAYLITHCHVSPWNILAVTFTNKAAHEMHERVMQVTPADTYVFVRTFHSFGTWFLRRYRVQIGMDSYFSIYDTDDSIAVLKHIYPRMERKQLSFIYAYIKRAKNYGLYPDSDLTSICDDPEFCEYYRAYQQQLQQLHAYDFGDLILEVLRILQEYPAIATEIQQRFLYVFVDEYQDTNGAQYQLLQALTNQHTYVCVVGDDDQSIYRFRGSEVQNILQFSEQFAPVDIIRLTYNYRSTASILHVANTVIAYNTMRLGKEMRAPDVTGSPVQLVLVQTHDAEAQWCIYHINAHPEIETAIMYRTNAQSRNFEALLLQHSIPYRIYGSVRFYEREEVRDALALLQLFVNPYDVHSFTRFTRKVIAGVGLKSIEKIIVYANHTHNGNIMAAMQSGILRGKSQTASKIWVKAYEESIAMFGSSSLRDIIKHAFMESGIWHLYESIDVEKHTQRVLNLEELLNAASLYESSVAGLHELLSNMNLDNTNREDIQKPAQVHLMTIHSAKGLEFERVFITGMEEGIFPRNDVYEIADVEEERRLFYVAITRAKTQLAIIMSSSRIIFGRRQHMFPSRFLSELPRNALSILDLTDHTTTKTHTSNKHYTTSNYPQGTKVFHDDYGYGYVIKTKIEDGNEFVTVRFEQGARAQFIPAFTPLEKVSDDF